MGSGIGGGGRGFGGEICKYRDMNADTKTLISIDLVMPPLSLFSFIPGLSKLTFGKTWMVAVVCGPYSQSFLAS